MPKLIIPANYFYKGSPEKILEFDAESIDRGIDNARKIFGSDFMTGQKFSEEGKAILDKEGQ